MLTVLKNARVLVTNDDEAALCVLTRHLKNAGCQVLEARCGSACLKIALEQPPDAIVLDVNLPDVNGNDVCHILRQNPGTASIPVLQVSAAYASDEDKMRGIEGGADAYLGAPFDPADVLIHLGVLLRTRQAEERFRLVARATGTFVYDLEVRSRKMIAVEGLERLLGYSPKEITFTMDWWWQQIHPEDLPRVKQEHQALCDSALPQRLNYRVRFRDGSYIDVEDTVQAVGDDRGQPRRVVGGVVDVTQRRRAEAQQNDYNQNLEAAVRERTAQLQEMIQELEQFSYSMVHDLRAPLRALQAFGQLLLAEESQIEPALKREYLQRLTTASRRMDQLITDALSYSRSVLAPMPVKTVNPAALLSSIIDTYPNLQPFRNAIHIVPPLPLLLANEAGLTQCFSSLLDNAFKFSRPGVPPEVRIWAETKPDTARVWFEDNGTGIADHFKSRIFEIFARGATGGNGIGLALVRKVTQRMGGQVGVETRENIGSRFWIELRLAPE